MNHPPKVYEPPHADVKGYEIHTALMEFHVSSKVPVAGKTPKYQPKFEATIRKELMDGGK